MTRHVKYNCPEEIPLTVRGLSESDCTDDESSPRHSTRRHPLPQTARRWPWSRSVVDQSPTVKQLYKPQVTLPDVRRTPPSSRGSLFTNFEDVQLTDEERLYLNAAALGEVTTIRLSVEESDSVLNVNCVDYMGRNALHLAIDSDNLEAIELLLDKLNFECIEESLLHAISKGATKIVKSIVEHPTYIAGESRIKRSGMDDPFFRTEEKSQFSPDITPLILASQYNSHEIIQMFLSRNHTIDKPHPISCACSDCQTKQNYDSLKRSRSRLNAYRALASPALMALSSLDPIMSTFELRQEMKKLAQVEKEFKNEYISLVEQCMNFAYEMMDLCRGTQEVEAVLSEEQDSLARLRMAIEYEEKKFVAHSNCQQHLTNVWYGPEMVFLQSLSLWKKIIMWVVCVPLLPFFCIIYIVSPESKLSCALRCPAAKFITHTLSHITFLILLAVATFRLEDKTYPMNSIDDLGDDRYEELTDKERWDSLIKGTLRPANTLMTNVQICLMFWVLGLLWMECKQMWNSGLRVYLLDRYNCIDFLLLSLYLSSYVLRFLVNLWIKKADQHFNGATVRAREALEARNYTLYNQLTKEFFGSEQSYFMKASRFEWQQDDPEIVSDVLFAIANVLSIARTTYLMPGFEVLGPLQISLGRMLGDITRFLVLFTLVLFGFMVGLHNLYWYYGSQTYKKHIPGDPLGATKLAHSTEAFHGLSKTLYSLFWSMFGLVDVKSAEIKYPLKRETDIYAESFLGGNHATSLVENVGMLLMALYHVIVIIVLVNMLIAMMSHSFEDIQTDCDVEWKFARTVLWMNYIDEGSTLPVPFNMIPTPKSIKYVVRGFKAMCRRGDGLAEFEGPGKRQTFIKMRREKVCQTLNIETPETSYADILQRLVRRYLFKIERNKMEETVKELVSTGADNYGYANATTGLPEPMYADSDEPDDPPSYPSAANSMVPPPIPGRARSGRRTSVCGGGGGGGGGGSNVQLLSIPQLDQIQRSLKLLDVRLQHVQSNAREDEKMKDDIVHIRRVMSENQKALSTVVTVLSSIQEELRTLSIASQNQSKNTFQLQPPSRKRSGERADSTTTVSLQMENTSL